MNESEANQTMEKKCPQCGAPLPSGVLEGLCPACLFKQGVAAETAVPPETAPFQPPSVEEVARLFPQLEILAFIGKGGMGAVYQGPPAGVGSPRRVEDSAAADRQRSGFCRALQSGSPRAGKVEPSQHRRRSRIRPGERAAVLPHGIRGWFEPAAVGAGRQTLAAPGAADCAADLRGAAIRPRRRHRPSRHQAGQHPGGQEGSGENRRFRHRQDLWAGRRRRI